MKQISKLLTGLLLLAATASHAQHMHHPMPSKTDTTAGKPAPAPLQHKHMDTGGMDTGHNMQMPGMQHNMTHAYSLSLPMNRNGSGTSWQPDATPMYAYMHHGKTMWNFMLHGNIFLRQTWVNFNNDYKRGGTKFDAPNWLMGMAQKQVGKNGLLNFELMLSLDPLTTGGNGYPLLFQSGESWKGRPLTDRQHPHDLFSGVGVGYTQRINKDMDISGYIGYPGEPALGPTAFMHRISSISNPDAPISHHWQDATHISFGVGTLGFRYKWLKAEGSIFTGREPDEERYGFDRPRFDSYSWRLNANPSKNFAVQVSQGYIYSPEALHPEENVTRTTASVIYSERLNKNLFLNSTLAWGMNDAGSDHREHSVLLESNAAWLKNMLYLRYEFVQKSPEELDLEVWPYMHKAEPVHAFTLGYSRTLITYLKTDLALGGQLSLYQPSAALETLYGTTPLSAQMYLRITPSMMR